MTNAVHRVAVMQPTYLPWAGYFHLMSTVDEFVFLDDVQLQRSSWHVRNRILLNGAELFLTVPTARAPLDTPLFATHIASVGHWQKKHWRSLVAAYGGAPHGKSVLDVLEPHYQNESPPLLVDWTVGLIGSLAKALGIATSRRFASALGCSASRTEHLSQILSKCGCTHYLTPPGAVDYLMSDGFERLSGVRLEVQAFPATPYEQHKSAAFVSHLSVVDVMANMGLSFARDYVHGNAKVSA